MPMGTVWGPNTWGSNTWGPNTWGDTTAPAVITYAPLYALSGVARSGATRSAAHSAKVFVKINGTQRAFNRQSETSKVLHESLRVHETNGGPPNTAGCTVMGFNPSRFEEVIMTLGSVNNPDRLFGGYVMRSTQRFAGKPEHVQYGVSMVDFGWRLNALVTGRFSGPADEIVIELAVEHAPDFDTSRVQTGLPTIDQITFTNVKLRTCFDRIAARIGGFCRTDYHKRILFGIEDYLELTNPQDLTETLPTLLMNDDTLSIERDAGQRVTRVHCEGGGGMALTEVPIGDTILPLDEAAEEWYGNVGGEVIIGESQETLSYTERVDGGGGSLVGSGAQPGSAPNVALAAGSGVTSGSHDVTVVFKTATGRSLPSAVATIDVGTVSAPSAAVTAGTPTSGGSMNAGTHKYYPVFRTASGSTTAGPVSNSVTALAGESAPGAVSMAGVSAFTHAAGVLNYASAYHWKFTYRRISDGSETEGSPATAVFGPAPSFYQDYDLSFPAADLPAVPSGYTLVWYRQKDGGGYKKCTNIQPNTPTWFVDQTTEGALGAAIPSSNNTAKGTSLVTGIPVYGSALVTHVDMYREFNAAGAATAKLAFSVANGTTSASDTVANSGLGATVPSTNTAVANQIAVSGIQIGGSGTTDRELYMSPAGGGARKRALVIANNVDTTGTITMSDATLAGELAEPGLPDTSGLPQPNGQVNPGSTSILVAGTAPFRSDGGWAFTGTQVVRYHSFSGSSLAGIPASGPGSIQQVIPYNTTIAAAPCLVGIPASGPGSIIHVILRGVTVNVWVTVDNLYAQAAISALIDPDDDLAGAAGIVADVLSDQRIGRAEALARAAARLDELDDEGVDVEYETWDKNTSASRTVVANIAAPTSLSETLRIQEVDINFQDTNPRHFPIRRVTASNRRYSFEALLRQAREAA